MEDKIITPPPVPRAPTETVEPVIPGPQSNSSFSSLDPRKNLKVFVAIVVVVVLIISAFIISFLFPSSSKNKQAQNSEQNKTNSSTEVFKPIAPYILMYGFWNGDKSKIQIADLSSGQIKDLATLPENIKKITALSINSLLYINNTDVQDHGSEIVRYDTKSNKTTPIVQASDGFGIDDYVMSPNKRIIVLWEVNIPEGKSLVDGRSRVYSVNLDNPNVKNLIYDDVLSETNPAHYPVAVTDNGQVFLDTFKPNDGAGWANGMFVSNFDGTIKSPIVQMASGTYGTQPKMSLDGKYLVFAGYNGNKGNGNDRSSGFRTALLIPNTLDTFNLETNERKTLITAANNSIFPAVAWDDISGKIFYTQVSSDSKNSGQYVYDQVASSSSKISILTDGKKDDEYTVITSVGPGVYFLGQKDKSSSNLGNLGSGYAKSLNKTGIYTNGKFVPLPHSTNAIQYIAVVPKNISATAAGFEQEGGQSLTKNQLQLQTFKVKPKLQETRENLQSNPPIPSPGYGWEGLPLCSAVLVARCNSLVGQTYKDIDEYLFAGSTEPGSVEYQKFDQCVKDNERNVYQGQDSTCSDSPLYLYGEKGAKVKVDIGIPISNSNAPYSNGYDGILTGDGGIEVKGVNYDSLEYKYVSAIKKLPTLKYGKTVESNKLPEVIREFGQRLGLNETEIADTIRKIGKLDSKYVFVSFFDDKTSKAILPISFTPTPDIYRNIVFYIKRTDKPIVSNVPKFEKYPARVGFTAIEVSYILE